MRKGELAELRAVFSDAHVVDVDFSEWDRFISIVVVADHLPPVRGRLPLVCARFFEVEMMGFCFPRHFREYPRRGQHFQWMISSIESKVVAHGVRFCFCGDDAMPKIEIVCGGVELSRISRNLYQKVNPGWDRPFGGLARPGIQRLNAVMSKNGQGGLGQRSVNSEMHRGKRLTRARLTTSRAAGRRRTR